MPRFHFATKDGLCFDDERGTELADVASAKDIAVRILAETLHGQSEIFWEHENFSVIVSDDTGLTLFSVDVSATFAPALRGGRRPN